MVLIICGFIFVVCIINNYKASNLFIFLDSVLKILNYFKILTLSTVSSIYLLLKFSFYLIKVIKY